MLDNRIFSIGYGNRKPEIFYSLLLKYQITTLIDIRTRPYSRFQPIYNKKRLEFFLNEIGMNYTFMGAELGGKPQNQMLYTDGKLDYGLVNATKDYQEALNAIIEKASIGEKLCLLCCELDENTCHRKTLVGASLFKRGIVVNHINKEGLITCHNQQLLF